MSPFTTFDDALVWFARRYLFVREAGQNMGQRVEAIIRWCGGQPGQSWCCYFVTKILDLMFGGNAPIPRGGVCQDVYALAKKNGWLTDTPLKGDLFVYVDANDHAYHIGFHTDPGQGLAGNTSEDGKSSNGDGVHEHGLISTESHVKHIKYPRPAK